MGRGPASTRGDVHAAGGGCVESQARMVETTADGRLLRVFGTAHRRRVGGLAARRMLRRWPSGCPLSGGKGVSSPSRWRVSVGATLLALVVLPTIGLGFSTAQIAADRSAAADLADRIGADADRVVTLVQLRFAVTDELIPTAALAYAPAFGIDGASISEIIGFDLAARQRNARREVDDRAARIQGAPEIRAAIAAIGLLRDDVDRGAAEPAAVLATYGAAEAAANREVADSVARLRLEIARLPRGDAAQPSLELLAEAVVALRAVLAQMEALGQSMLSPLSRSEAPIVLAKALGSYEQATERLDALLSGPARSLWREIRNDPATRTFEGAVAAYLRSTLEGAPATVGPAPQVAPVFRAGIERAEHHLEMVGLLADELRDQATVLKDDAHASFQRAVLGAGSITLLTMAITLWVVQTLRRPLGALEERARPRRRGRWTSRPSRSAARASSPWWHAPSTRWSPTCGRSRCRQTRWPPAISTTLRWRRPFPVSSASPSRSRSRGCPTRSSKARSSGNA
jgi:hypothetical protein